MSIVAVAVRQPSVQPVSIAVVAYRDVLRAGLVGVLERCTSLNVAVQAARLRDLPAALPGRIQVLIHDMDSAGGLPETEIARARRQYPRVSVIAFTTEAIASQKPRALAAGAMDCLSADAPTSRLEAAVLAAASAESTLAAPLITLQPVQLGCQMFLTARELEVLRLIARALPNKAIAHSLAISEGTVKRHTNSLYRKLGVGSRLHAVHEAVRIGML